MKTKLVSSIALILASGSLLAEEAKVEEYGLAFNQQKVRFFMEAGVQGGGDSTETLPIYTRAGGGYVYGVPLTLYGNWNGISSDLEQTWTDKAEAGGLYKIAAGAEFSFADQFSVITSVGFQFDDVYGDLTDGSGGKGSFAYQKFTFEVIPFFNYGRHRVGIGGEFHYNNTGVHKEYASGFNLKSTYDFDNSLGAVLRYDYLVNKNVSVGLKYTDISYDLDKVTTLYKVGTTTAIDSSSKCTTNCEDLVEANSVGVHLTYSF